jgi:lipoprotein-releasing system permease protein
MPGRGCCGTLRLSRNLAIVSSFPVFVGLRYSRSRQRTRFISVISLISVVGIALGMTVLITVLSVFNGFQRDVRAAMLKAIPHAQILGFDGGLSDWQSLASQAEKNPHVLAAAPYVEAQGLLTSSGHVRGAFIWGIDPSREPRVSELATSMRSGSLAELRPGEFNVVLGAPLSRALGVRAGDKVVLVSPQGQATPAGILPRLRQFTVVGIAESGHYKIDAALALVHIEDAQRLYRLGDQVSGVRLKLDDALRAREIVREIAQDMPGDVTVSDWSRTDPTYFRAVALEKRMMSLLLFFIIAIAAFNLVSSLFMVVKEKQADIAILRTMGASPGDIMRIFMVQGTLIGLGGVVCGVLLGTVCALNVADIVGFVESLFRFKFMPQDVYLIKDLPSELHAADVVGTALLSFLLAALATIYPSWRAARVNPAEALRYE